MGTMQEARSLPHGKLYRLLTLLAGLSLLVACGEPAVPSPTAVPIPPPATATAAATATTAPPPTATVASVPPAAATVPPPATAILPPTAAATAPLPDTAAPAATPAGAWTVTATDVLELPRGAAFLAPDGKTIAWSDGKQICLYSPAGVKGTCARAHTSVDPNTIRWAQDSTRLAFTENFVQYLNDPDIWILDAATGRMTDLTDDGVDKVPLSGAFTGLIDVAPTWAADSRQLLFGRATALSRGTPLDLYTIPAQGGSPRKVGTLNAAPVQVYALAWTRDGMQLAYNFDAGPMDDPHNGAWLARLDGQGAQQLLGLPTITDVQLSPDDRYLLGFSPVPIGLGQPGSSSRVVALAGGPDLPIDPTGADWATWAPAGSALAYLVRAATSPIKAGLYVAGAPGAPGRQVLAGSFAPPGDQASWRTLSWAANNTILLARPGDGKTLLVHLTAAQG